MYKNYINPEPYGTFAVKSSISYLLEIKFIIRMQDLCSWKQKF